MVVGSITRESIHQVGHGPRNVLDDSNQLSVCVYSMMCVHCWCESVAR